MLSSPGSCCSVLAYGLGRRVTGSEHGTGVERGFKRGQRWQSWKQRKVGKMAEIKGMRLAGCLASPFSASMRSKLVASVMFFGRGMVVCAGWLNEHFGTNMHILPGATGNHLLYELW